ncbi:MAG: ATP-binding protein [Desulfuromonadaceae bacterium]|nr:ATP-binding protein [Desulfuromonadaceae bacterium]
MNHSMVSDYMAHGFCFSWEPGLVWLHVVSDIFTGIAYYAIAFAMVYFIYKRRDEPFALLFLLFALFIMACGTTHFFAVYTVYVPEYWQEGYVKAFTMVISVIAAILFIPKIPMAIEMPSLAKTLKDLQLVSAEQQRTEEELNLKVAELERFAYTVSHDLKSPIITIKGFTGALEKDLLHGNYDRMAGDLKRISGAADKMNDLLRDLLELSTVGRVISTPEPVDMNLLLDEVLAQLAGPLKNNTLKVEVQPGLPTIFCDRRRMGEVLQNLFENAINFMGDQAEPRIQFGMRKESENNIFFVLDNGIGIDEKYHQNIFGLFNKLDSNSEGTGVGLALVKRIIEAHAGRAWVESEGVGKGSRFCFTLPGN